MRISDWSSDVCSSDLMRNRLAECMWNDAGIVRDKAGLERAAVQLDELCKELLTLGVADGDRAYNLTWQDWLNLDSLLHVSQAIVQAALAREDSRGAHFREDHPDVHDLEKDRKSTRLNSSH